MDDSDSSTNSTQFKDGANTLAAWTVIHVKPRVDSFNQDVLMNEIRDLHAQGKNRIALDLKANRFLSFPVIRFCTDISKDLAQSGGEMVLISCPQKTKRHFEIYGSLDHIRLFRSEGDLGGPPAGGDFSPSL